MFKSKIYLLKATVCALALALALPQLTLATLSREELKDKERQTDLRIEMLKEDIDVKEGSLSEIGGRISYLQNNIAQIEKQLVENEQRIAELARSLAEREVALSNTKDGLSDALRDLQAAQNTSLVALLFRSDSFSEAIREIDERQLIAAKIGEKYSSMINYTESLAAARDQMELAKLSLASSRVSLELQHQALQFEMQHQQASLSASQALLNAAESDKAFVRRQMFAASPGSGGGQSITLDQAIGFAQLASKRLKEQRGQTLPASLLLALVKQETNFGSYLGSGHYASSMCSQREISTFLEITKRLNLDPDTTLVSKPAKFQSCGGAMGYAQFLPTTWEGYAQDVAQLTGHSPASPWNPEDAFTAVALKLASNGATRGNTAAQLRQSQWEAVMTYFSGSRWKNPAILANIRFYGDRIMDSKDAYASLIGE